jgi:hypothetical protein
LSWGPNKSALHRAALAALLATLAASAAANVLVVRSSGPSAKAFAPGRSLPDNAQLTLRAGDTVIVLGANGTRTFRGPGNFSPSSSVQASNQTVTGSNGRRARVGAVRSAPIIPTTNPATIWQVDPTQSGTACLVPSLGVKLWRADSGRTETLTITGPDGRAQTVQWPAGQAMLDWPVSVALANNAEYQLRLSSAPVPSRIRVKTLDTPPQSVQAVAESLIRNECNEQLDLLVAAQPSL